MEFVKTAEDVLYDDDGELIMEQLLDADGYPVQGPNGVVMRPKPDPKGVQVLTSTEPLAAVTPKAIADALKGVKGKVEHVSATAGAAVVVRVRGRKA